MLFLPKDDAPLSKVVSELVRLQYEYVDRCCLQQQKAKSRKFRWTTLAQEAGLNKDTLNQQRRKGAGFDAVTLLKLQKLTGLPAPQAVPSDDAAVQVNEESADYNPSLDTANDRFIRQLLNESPNIFTRRILSDELVSLGLFPGDVAVFDAAATPRNGDIVCVQDYFAETTVVRLFKQNILILPHAMPSEIKATFPGESVHIAGVMTHLFRLRR